MARPRIERTVFKKTSRGDEPLEIPVATIHGRNDGPTFTVMSGMHAGEYAGVLAAQRMITSIGPEDLSGTLRVIPVISTRAFMARYMQLSPVDDREVHFYGPGNPDHSYTEFHVDALYSIIRDSDYVIDMHSGEFAQSLMPWIPVPMIGDRDLQLASLSLARGYPVTYVEPRTELEAIPALASHLCDDGIANLWAEIGKNGLPEKVAIDAHYAGATAALQTTGMLEGAPPRPPQTAISGRRYQINASRSGVWHPEISEGEVVEEGQELGRMTDYFGREIEVYRAPERSLVVYYWSSPAIDHTRRPHGYDWHSGLVRLLAIDSEQPVDDVLR